VSLLQILEKVFAALPGIVAGIEAAFASATGSTKKAEALKAVADTLDGIAAAGHAVPKDALLVEAGDLIDAYVKSANAIGAFAHVRRESWR